MTTDTTPLPGSARASEFDGVPTVELMRRGLDLTARKTSADEALAAVRAELADRARAEVAATGVVPTWRVTGLGRAQLSDPQPRVAVRDEAALASWAAQRFPEHVTATLSVPAADLERALEALEDAAVAPIRATSVSLAVAAKWRAGLLEEVGTAHEVGEVIDEPQDVWYSRTGEVVDGVALMPAAPRTFSLVLDAEAKKRAKVEAAGLLPEAGLASASTRPGHDGWGGGLPPEPNPELDVVPAAWSLDAVADDAEGEPEYHEDLPVEDPPAEAVAPAEPTVLPSAPMGERLLFLRQLAGKDLGAQPIGTLRVWIASGGVQVNERAPKPTLVKKLAAAIADALALEHVPAEPTTGS